MEDALFTWARRCGIFIAPQIALLPVPSRGRGLVAAHGPIANGKTILRIPRTLWVTSQRLSAAHSHLDAERHLATRLAAARDDATHRHHIYASYLSSLPLTRTTAPSSFETDDAKERWEIYQQWEANGIVEAWALHHALSRAHYGKKVVNLLPILDFANHEGSEPNCAYQIVKDDSRGGAVSMCFYASVRGDIPQGSECVYPYSSYDPTSVASRDRWRLYAGFLPAK